jgi:hypothetical protein
MVGSSHQEEQRAREQWSLDQIAHYLDATTDTPEHADLIFVPGTRLAEPAWMAAALMAEGVAPLVVVTGGINRFTRASESAALQAELISHGVARDQILVETRSTNTLENVVNAWRVVANRIGGQPVTSVLAVCKWMHSRRVLMTLKAHFPPGVHYYACTYAPDGVTRDVWSGGVEVPQTADVMGNWNNIPVYLARGDIQEITRSNDGSWL